jgi:hypothetical protein
MIVHDILVGGSDKTSCWLLAASRTSIIEDPAFLYGALGQQNRMSVHVGAQLGSSLTSRTALIVDAQGRRVGTWNLMRVREARLESVCRHDRREEGLEARTY